MSEPKIRQSVLVVDDGAIDTALLQKSLTEKLRDKPLQLSLIMAKDGPNASTKFANQKFDAVIFNTTVPRVVESGLDRSFASPKSGFHGLLYVIGGKKYEAVENLATKKFPLPVDAQALIDALIDDLVQPTKTTVAAHPSFAVDVRVLNAIIAATRKVLGQFDMKTISMEKAAPRTLQEPMAGVISSLIDIQSSGFRGQLSISFDEGSFLEMASGMLCEEQTTINDENQDAVGEINNIIFGNAKGDLESYGVQLAIPKVVRGAGQMMTSMPGAAALRVPFQTAKGHFYIDLIAFPAR